MMMRRDVGIGHNVAVDKLVVGRSRRPVAVSVRVIVAAVSRRQHVMIGAERAIDHEGKRRHHREGGRDTSAHQMGETNHPYT